MTKPNLASGHQGSRHGRPATPAVAGGGSIGADISGAVPFRQRRTAIATVADGLPAWTRRARGYVTATMIREHGTYARARDWLDRQQARLSTRGAE